MKLPHQLLENVGFVFGGVDDLLRAFNDVNEQEALEIRRLFALGLPPVTSLEALAVASGYNPGFVHSMTASVKAHYRFFSIPKGTGVRNIVAPKVALKGIQKWLSVHLERKYNTPACVYGFVPGKSHIDAAKVHLGAKWICSVDIEDFFPSVTNTNVSNALRFVGYQTEECLEILTRLFCIRGALVQGLPASPVLSNIVLRDLDLEVAEFALRHDCRYTRYADDIVLSGESPPPDDLLDTLQKLVIARGWRISDRKSSFDSAPNRLKVHGLLVHGDQLRLTKGYRNRIRAFKHLLSEGKIDDADRPKILGHLNYAAQVERTIESGG